MKNRYLHIFSLLVALLSFATFSACEVDDKINFVTDNTTGKEPELILPNISNPEAGKTTVVLYVPENTPSGCYAVGDINGWNVENTDYTFTPISGDDSKRWVACTIEYSTGMQMKVLAIPSDSDFSLGWAYQWGKNMDPENNLKEDNVVILDGVGTLRLENQGQPVLGELEDGGVVYIQVKSWATTPVIKLNPLKEAWISHPWNGNNWRYQKMTKIDDNTFEYAGSYGGGNYGVKIAADANGTSERHYSNVTIMYDAVLNMGDSVKFTFVSKDQSFGKIYMQKININTSSIPGIDYSAAVIHDFSIATGNAPLAFTDGLTRGTDFDGEYVLLVTRTDAETASPHLYKVKDLLDDNMNTPYYLNTTGIEGGALLVSSGCLSQGHIYICNMTTQLSNGDNLKVYHYASPTAKPDVWSWNGVLGNSSGTAAMSRLGDNISVNIDENGNGYAFFCGQYEDLSNRIYRVQITNFNHFSNPIEINCGVQFAYYGYVNEVPEKGQYLLKSYYSSIIRLMDANGNPLIEDIDLDETDCGLRTGLDPHIVTFNNSRYLIWCTPYNDGRRLGSVPGLYIQDITNGVDTRRALIRWSELLYSEEDLWTPTYFYSLDPTQPEAGTIVTASTAQCNAAEVDGKLVVFTAVNKAGFVLVEFPKAK